MRAALDRRSHLLLAISCVLLLALAEWANLDDHLWKLWQEVSTPQTVKDNALWLPDYQATSPAMVIPVAESNTSGITYDPDRDSLWIVADRPPQLLELDRQLTLKRRIALSHFVDPEAIVYLGEERFVIADERSQTLVVAGIDADTTELDRNALPQLSVRLGPKGNKGLEGIAYDRERDVLYAVRERDPLALLQIEGFLTNRDNMTIDTAPAINVQELFMDDLSGLHFDQTSGHLLVLSHESMLLAEVSREGERISYLDLERGFNQQVEDIPQAEGVTVDAQGNLYIVGEPNLIYRFSRTP